MKLGVKTGIPSTSSVRPLDAERHRTSATPPGVAKVPARGVGRCPRQNHGSRPNLWNLLVCRGPVHQPCTHMGLAPGNPCPPGGPMVRRGLVAGGLSSVRGSPSLARLGGASFVLRLPRHPRSVGLPWHTDNPTPRDLPGAATVRRSRGPSPCCRRSVAGSSTSPS